MWMEGFLESKVDNVGLLNFQEWKMLENLWEGAVELERF